MQHPVWGITVGLCKVYLFILWRPNPRFVFYHPDLHFILSRRMPISSPGHAAMSDGTSRCGQLWGFVDRRGLRGKVPGAVAPVSVVRSLRQHELVCFRGSATADQISNSLGVVTMQCA